MAGCGGKQPAEEPPIGAAEIEDPRRFGAVVAQQVIHTDRRDAQLESALAELTEVGGLPPGKRLLIGTGLGVARPPVAMAQLPHGLVHHLGRHRAIGGELSPDHRQHPA